MFVGEFALKSGCRLVWLNTDSWGKLLKAWSPPAKSMTALAPDWEIKLLLKCLSSLLKLVIVLLILV